MNLPPLPIGVKNSVSAAPDFLMGLAFLVTWIEPMAFGGGMMKYFAIILLLEFITIHSAGFLGFAIISGKNKLQKVSFVIGLAVFYSFFIFSLSSPPGVLWPLGTFWLLILNRILGVLLGDSSEISLQVIVVVRWAWSVLFFVVSVVISLMVPIPKFGWYGEIVHRLGPGGAGVWYEQPHTLLAAGFFYFVSVSIFEIYSSRIMIRFSNINLTNQLFKK